MGTAGVRSSDQIRSAVAAAGADQGAAPARAAAPPPPPGEAAPEAKVGGAYLRLPHAHGGAEEASRRRAVLERLHPVTGLF